MFGSSPPKAPVEDETTKAAEVFAIGIGECGSCTVHIDGQAEKACTIPIEDVNGSQIITIEGLAENHPVKRAWVLEQEYQDRLSCDDGPDR